jgi:hypothetical protein
MNGLLYASAPLLSETDSSTRIRMDGPQNRCERDSEKRRKSISMTGIEIRVPIP